MTILSDYIKHLHLRADAPYPWQVLRDDRDDYGVDPDSEGRVV